MKGLLCKELYSIRKYGGMYILLMLVFVLIAPFANGNLFMIIYPCVLAGVMPTTLLSYDERDKWEVYSAALPYSRAQLVSAKYVCGLFVQIPVVLVTVLIQWLRMSRMAAFDPNEFISLIATILAVPLLMPAFTLPLVFKIGVEKSRLAYIIAVFAGSLIGVYVSMVVQADAVPKPSSVGMLICLVLGEAAVYILSWLLSIHFYKKREFN